MPLAPILTVLDNADGSGGLATIAGSSPGSTNTVSVNPDGSTAWTVGGFRIGDGPVALDLPRGYFWVKCDSLLAGQSVVSNVARLPVTTALDSIHLRAALALQARFQTLAMPLLKAVHLHALPDENAVTFPCVVLWFNEAEQMLGGSNQRDDIGYPVKVAIAVRNDVAFSVKPEWILSYRWRMLKSVRYQKLAGVPEIKWCEVVPELVVDEKLPMYNYLISGFTVIPISREVRG